MRNLFLDRPKHVSGKPLKANPQAFQILEMAKYQIHKLHKSRGKRTNLSELYDKETEIRRLLYLGHQWRIPSALNYFEAPKEGSAQRKVSHSLEELHRDDDLMKWRVPAPVFRDFEYVALVVQS